MNKLSKFPVYRTISFDYAFTSKSVMTSCFIHIGCIFILFKLLLVYLCNTLLWYSPWSKIYLWPWCEHNPVSCMDEIVQHAIQIWKFLLALPFYRYYYSIGNASKNYLSYWHRLRCHFSFIASDSNIESVDEREMTTQLLELHSTFPTDIV